MTTYAQSLLGKIGRKGVLIDTNLLLLYVIGSFDLSIIATQRFKRTDRFTVEDFDLLQRLVSYCGKAVTTTHVLTEVSNLAGQLPGKTKLDCFGSFEPSLLGFEEVAMESVPLLSNKSFPYLGLTDTALASVASEFLIVTADLRFEREMNRLGINILNINHLRAHLWS